MMKPMYLVKDGVEYQFTFHQCGWSYAEVRVRIKSSFLWIPYWKSIWETSHGFGNGAALAGRVVKAKKSKIQAWCENALEEYLEHEESWK
jgi:hypothetical protein